MPGESFNPLIYQGLMLTAREREKEGEPGKIVRWRRTDSHRSPDPKVVLW